LSLTFIAAGTDYWPLKITDNIVNKKFSLKYIKGKHHSKTAKIGQVIRGLNMLAQLYGPGPRYITNTIKPFY
jgi:hypothetical protein